MTPFAIGVVTGLLALQAAINAPRSTFMDCLSRASQAAAGANVPPNEYSDYVNLQCASAANSYKSALVSFDVKNGIKKARATADAETLVEEDIAMYASQYSAKVNRAK